jgi:two-component system sensor histidine kinase PilS (NtrC family)
MLAPWLSKLLNPSTSTSPSPYDWQLLRIYSIYRVLLASCILIFFIVGDKNTTGGGARTYFALATAYLGLCILTAVITRTRLDLPRVQAFIAFLIDISLLTGLQYAQAAKATDLTLLQVVAVAAGSIILRGRMPYFLAAIASLSILAQDVALRWLDDKATSSDISRAGLMGMSMFATAFFAQQLANRLRESEALAEKQAGDLASLEELNHHIIQRMRTGIIVVNAKDEILMINDSCWKMFNMPALAKDSPLEQLSVELQQQLTTWRQNSLMRGKPFRAVVNGPDVIANFTPLETGILSDVLIFVDDNTRMAQQAQQLKLASLGGLTASIAHEIRNPLGAISHAAQLLGESSELSSGDMRLADIIQKNSLRMNRVIENVLQLSRRRPTQPELNDLCAWVRELVADYKSGSGKDCDIEVRCQRNVIEFRVDLSQMQQVFHNLIQNGLRYSEKQTGSATLQLNVGVTLQTEQPYVDVIDRGPGVAPEQADKIFEPFYTSEKTGTGLGLYIARELCEANQARLDYIPIRSGSCFRVTFAHPGRNMAV